LVPLPDYVRAELKTEREALQARILAKWRGK